MSRPRARTILLVEDEAILGMREKHSLEQLGYAVLVSATGEDAINKVAKSPEIDLVLMDIDLGAGMDGTEAAQAILASHHLPLLFLSSHAEADVIARTEKANAYGYVIKGSSPAVLDGSIKMAFKLHAAYHLLQENEERFHSLFEQAPLGYQSLNEDGYFIEVNRAWLETLGYDREEVLGKWFGDFLAPEYVEAFRERFPLFKARGKIHAEFRMKHKKGHILYIAFEGRIAHQADGAFQKTHCILSDITELKRKELALQESENRYRNLVEMAADGILLGSHEGYVIGVNDSMCRMTGLAKGDIVGTHISQLPFAQESLARKPLRFDLLQKGETVVSEREICRPDGTKLTVEMLSKMMPDGTYQSFVRDMTERKNAEDKIQKLLEEKECLLKEVHHRIKNNMSAIYWFLVLQAETLTDAGAVKALQDAGSRVQSMMVLYDRLYRSEHFTDLSVANYLVPLTQEIISNFPDHDRIELTTEVESFTLSAKQLSALGILLNELLTNAVKHAFPDGRPGKIHIAMKLVGGVAHFSVEDDGAGLPDGIELESSTGFGMQLIMMVVEQLQGTIKLVRQDGTRFEVDFPVGAQ
jgi:PAS domain S-box-containing protein